MSRHFRNGIVTIIESSPSSRPSPPSERCLTTGRFASVAMAIQTVLVRICLAYHSARYSSAVLAAIRTAIAVRRSRIAVAKKPGSERTRSGLPQLAGRIRTWFRLEGLDLVVESRPPDDERWHVACVGTIQCN